MNRLAPPALDRHFLAGWSACFLWLAFVGPASAQTSTGDDPYGPGRALMADIQRIVTPGGVQETFEATLGGTRQAVSVRGADRNNPLLVFVHGGRGARGLVL